MYSGKHSQFPFPLQIAFGPHGDGLHGPDANGRSVAIKNKLSIISFTHRIHTKQFSTY